MGQAEEIQTEKQPRAILNPLSAIKSKSIDWLWQDRIALGKLTIYAGDPSLGKSMATLDVVARVSRGLVFFDGSPCPEGASVILTSEDDPADTIKPRLTGMEADMDKIYIFAGTRDEKGRFIASCSLQQTDLFRDVISQIQEKGQQLRLLVIDPLESFLGGNDSNSNEDVRRALDGICYLAEQEHFAIIGIKHLNKGNGRAAYRVGGSIAWTAKARAVWMFVQDEETGRKFFLLQKNNTAKHCGGFEYSIESKTIFCDDGKEISIPVIKWGEKVREDANVFINRQNIRNKYNPSAQEEVLAPLKKTDGPMSTGEIAAAVNKELPATSKLLKKLADKGLVTSPEHGKWVAHSNLADKNA